LVGSRRATKLITHRVARLDGGGGFGLLPHREAAHYIEREDVLVAGDPFVAQHLYRMLELVRDGPCQRDVVLLGDPPRYSAADTLLRRSSGVTGRRARDRTVPV